MRWDKPLGPWQKQFIDMFSSQVQGFGIGSEWALNLAYVTGCMIQGKLSFTFITCNERIISLGLQVRIMRIYLMCLAQGFVVSECTVSYGCCCCGPFSRDNLL